MTKRTEREFHIALGKLLDRVRVQNSWSAQSFTEAAKHVANISKSEAFRFFKALEEMSLLTPASDKRKLTPNFDVIVWKNIDKKISLVKDVLSTHPNILQSRGRVKGKHYPKKSVKPIDISIEEPILAIIPQEEVINPLEYFSAQDLVAELRNRGFTVTASRQIITVEEI